VVRPRGLAVPRHGTEHTEGRLDGDECLTVVAETDGLVVFGDGMESTT
jgi:hypothetical protein